MARPILYMSPFNDQEWSCLAFFKKLSELSHNVLSVTKHIMGFLLGLMTISIVITFKPLSEHAGSFKNIWKKNIMSLI